MTTLYQQIEQAPRHQVNRILHHLMYVNPEAHRFMTATLNQQPIDATGDPADDWEDLGMIDDDLSDIPFPDVNLTNCPNCGVVIVLPEVFTDTTIICDTCIHEWPVNDDEPDEASYVTGWIDGREGYA